MHAHQIEHSRPTAGASTDIHTGVWGCARTPAELIELQPEWEALFAANPLHSPFLAWGWVDAWRRHLAGPHEPCIVHWRDDCGRLQFVLPLIVRHSRSPFGSGVVTLACGDGPECSDYLGALRLPAHDERLVELIDLALARFIDPGNLVRLAFLSADEALAGALGTAAQARGRRSRITVDAVCPRLSLPNDLDTFMGQLSSNFRSQARRHFNRIGRQDGVAFRTFDASEAPAFVQELIRLNRQRISEKGDTSSLEDVRLRDFLQDAVPYMGQRGIAWMDAVEENGTVIGAALNFAQGNAVYYYMGGFDSDASKLRPGIALFVLAIGRAIERGFRAYDFLRGPEAYKYRWGAVDTALESVELYPAALAGSAAWLSAGARRAIRDLLRRVRGAREG